MGTVKGAFIYSNQKFTKKACSESLFLAMLFYVASRDCAAALALDRQHTHLALHIPSLHHEVPANTACGIFAQIVIFVCYQLQRFYCKSSFCPFRNIMVSLWKAKAFTVSPSSFLSMRIISEHILGLYCVRALDWRSYCWVW